MSPVLSIDFETASTVDLRRTGVSKYAHAVDTLVLCLAYRFDQQPVQTWRIGEPPPQAVLAHVGSYLPVRAWNAKFELNIWNYVFARQLNTNVPRLIIGQLRDTMAQAVYWGLPLSLDQASEALKLSTTKDKAGHSLMLQMCKPRSYDLAGQPVWWHETDPAKFDRLVDYCVVDVEVESYIAELLPPLPDREQRIWELDARINQAGVVVDLLLARKLQALADAATLHLDKRMKGLAGCSLRQPANILQALADSGVNLPDTKRATLLEALPKVQRGTKAEHIIRTRLDGARSSAAKLRAIENAALPLMRGQGFELGVVRGALQHYGAGRTGRWAGRLVQPQNIPRPTIKNVEQAVEVILAGADVSDVEMLFSDSTMGVVASCLRSCIRAQNGMKLVVADLSQIEARVVAWLAGQADVLDVFARGEDVYTFAANKIGSKDRQLGKVMTLGLGFGMGGDKFQATAKLYGIKLDTLEAHLLVRKWRDANPAIAQLWWDVDRAARTVALNPFARQTVGGCVFYRKGKAMFVVLPSGRELVYREIRLVHDTVTGQEALQYMGVNQMTKRWGPIRTYGGKLVENIVQATARDVMADTMLHMFTDHARVPTLTVHDEIIYEAADPDAPGLLQALLQAMRSPPAWAAGLPVNADGYVSDRYRK